MACVSKGIRERPPQQGTAYRGFVDPSGGSADSFTLAIAHLDNTRNVVVVDVLRGRKPPFSPEHVVGEFATLLKNYGVSQISGDLSPMFGRSRCSPRSASPTSRTPSPRARSIPTCCR